jgi:hypothetical protein
VAHHLHHERLALGRNMPWLALVDDMTVRSLSVLLPVTVNASSPAWVCWIAEVSTAAWMVPTTISMLVPVRSPLVSSVRVVVCAWAAAESVNPVQRAPSDLPASSFFLPDVVDPTEPRSHFMRCAVGIPAVNPRFNGLDAPQ